MFCRECDYALGDGQHYIWTMFGRESGGKEPMCLDCAINLDLVVNGQRVWIYPNEETGE